MQDPKDSIWWRLINLQPSVWRGLVIAVVATAGTFGLSVAADKTDALVLVIVAVLPILQAIWTKAAVTPNAKVAVRVPDPVNDPNTVEAGPAVVNAPADEVLAAAQEEGE